MTGSSSGESSIDGEIAPERTRPSIRSIVVAMDDSAAAASALVWAQQMIDGEGGVVSAVSIVRRAEDFAERTRRLETDWAGPAGGKVRCHVMVGRRAASLLAYAAEVSADLIVVGEHGRPGLGPHTLGRLTASLIQETNCPLAIVPEGLAPTLDETSTILVAIDHGRPSAAALNWAAGLAAARSTHLSLFTAVPNRPVFRPDRLLDALTYYIDPRLVRQWALDDLDELAEKLQSSTTQEFDVSTSTAFGSAGSRTVQMSNEADVLVTALRRGGRWWGDHVPLAVHHALTHAPCPVVLVPDEPEADPAHDLERGE